MKFLASIVLLSSTVLAQSSAKPAITGTWVGSVAVKGQSVPIFLRIAGSPSALTATLLNGSDGTPASSATFQDGHLQLNFSYFARSLDATLTNGNLTGTFGGKRKGFFPVTLHPAKLAKAPALPKPDVLGDWEIAVNNSRGESAWVLKIAKSYVPQETIRAVIQRIDGDTGALYGVWSEDHFLVSHATAAGFELLTIKPLKDGTLAVTDLLDEKPAPLIARRPADARKENLAPPTDTAQQTTIKDPNALFPFSFPDLTGKTVSNTDPQFDGKVVIIAIGGSWCPNCHDEAPFLQSLYQKFHTRGLAIVNLSFEEEDQLKNPTRLRAFVQRYGLTYNVLLAGTTDQLNEKVTVANNLNCWPTSFFLGRDGRVKEIHAGYAGPANPSANAALTHEVTELVEHLLAEPAPVRSASLQ